MYVNGVMVKSDKINLVICGPTGSFFSGVIKKGIRITWKSQVKSKMLLSDP